MTTLETRRIRGDLIEVYRIMNGIEAIDWKLLFSKAPYDGTRGHTMKLEKKVIRLDICNIFFPQITHTGMPYHKSLLMQKVLISSRVN